jgi:hypothetical protein
VDPDAFFTASAPAHAGAESSRALSPPITSASQPLSAMSIVQALVAPGSGESGHGAATGGDAAATRGCCVTQDGLGMDMLNDVLDRRVDKDRHAHTHADAGEQQAAQQSPGGEGAGKPLSLFYSSSDTVRDAMDVLVASPRSPSEVDCRIAGGKSAPASPARSVGGSAKLENGIVLPEGDEGGAVGGGRAPSGSTMQDGVADKVASGTQDGVVADAEKVEALVGEVDGDNCASVRHTTAMDPMISALI